MSRSSTVEKLNKFFVLVITTEHLRKRIFHPEVLKNLRIKLNSSVNGSIFEKLETNNENSIRYGMIVKYVVKKA